MEQKLNYCSIVCNFLNNTQGYITENQIRFMLLELFDLDIEESVIEKYLNFDITSKLNSAIAWDDDKNLFKDLQDLSIKIKNDIKEDE